MSERHASRVTSVRETLLRWYSANGRELPWRETDDPYAILVSRGDAPADPGRSGDPALDALARAVADRRCARGGDAGRGDSRVAGPRLQPAGSEPPSDGADRGARTAGRTTSPNFPASAPTPPLRSGTLRSGGISFRSTRTSGASRSGPARASTVNAPRRSSISGRRFASPASPGAACARSPGLPVSRTPLRAAQKAVAVRGIVPPTARRGTSRDRSGRHRHRRGRRRLARPRRTRHDRRRRRPGAPRLSRGDRRQQPATEPRAQPPLPTLRIGAFSTMFAFFMVSLPAFASALIWSSCPSTTGLTPAFQVTHTSAQSGL